jgi:hypothetical protein
VIQRAIAISPRKRLQRTRVIDGWWCVILDLAGVAASGLNGLNNPHALFVSNLAEDDVLAIQPGSDNGCNEELGAVGVWAGVGHGEETWLGVLDLEVLVLELLAVDGLSTSALQSLLDAVDESIEK